MGGYLRISGNCNCTKSTSHLALNMMREILPDKQSFLWGRIFSLSLEEVAEVLKGVTDIVSHDYTIEEYLRRHSDEYKMDDFEEIKEDMWWIQCCFAKTFADMVLLESRYIRCELV